MKIETNKPSSYSLTNKEEWILIVLLAAHEKSSELYGLQIIEAIKNRSDDDIHIATGTLYPLLRRLEKKGMIVSRWEDGDPDSLSERGGARRRFYEITGIGISALEFLENLRCRLRVGWT